MSEAVSGTLEDLGLDEIDAGIIEDTFENRRVLQTQDPPWTFERVRDEDGTPNGFIRPISPAALTATRRSVHSRRRSILTDPENPWADYVHPDDYPLDLDMPWWVEMRLRSWREQSTEGVPEHERRPFPIRCTQLRTDNTRCWNWVGNPDKLTLCKPHTNQTREGISKTPAYARERVLELSIEAVDTLAYLMNHADGEAVRLKASTEVLDRAGVRGGVEVDVSGTVVQVDPSKMLADRLATLAKRAEDVITEEPGTALALPPATATLGDVVEAEILDEENEAL